jgi:hypothetical protein
LNEQNHKPCVGNSDTATLPAFGGSSTKRSHSLSGVPNSNQSRALALGCCESSLITEPAMWEELFGQMTRSREARILGGFQQKCRGIKVAVGHLKNKIEPGETVSVRKALGLVVRRSWFRDNARNSVPVSIVPMQ